MTNDEKIKVDFYFEEIDASMKENDFQRDFYESIRDQWEKKQWLSEKQIAALNKIYERVTS